MAMAMASAAIATASVSAVCTGKNVAGLSATSATISSLAFKRSYEGLGRSFQARISGSRLGFINPKPVVGFSQISSGFSRRMVVSASIELPLVGNVAPDFEAEAVFDQEFVKIKLSEYLGQKYVVLFFYPLDFTFVCPTVVYGQTSFWVEDETEWNRQNEITAFSDKYSEFEKLNTEVIGISTDSVFSHLAWIQTDRKSGGLGDLKYPLVSDLTKKISTDFKVLIPDQGIALRGLFIIDKEGVIQHATINNLAIGRSVEETLRTLQAVQYVQENPDEVCPAGWKPGEKTMKPDSKLSKEYFQAI